MDNSRIESELKEIRIELREQGKTLVANTSSLQEHMRRTDALEKRMDSLPAKAIQVLTLISGFLALAKIALQ